MQKLMKLLLVFVFLLASWFLHPQSAALATDNQASKVTSMLAALRDGQFPVRWVSTLAANGQRVGEPLFEFTAPLPYYVGASVLWLGLPVSRTLTILLAIPIILSLVGGYFGGRKLFGKWGSVIGPILICVIPYHSVSEAWALMSLPWILLGMSMVIRPNRHDKYGWQILLVGLVTLFLSQAQSLQWWLIFAIFMSAFALMTWFLSERKFRALVNFYMTFLLALGLSAFYLIPLYGEKNVTSLQAIQPAPMQVNEALKVTPLINRSHEQLFSISSTKPIEFNLAVPNFPGWRVEIDGKAASTVQLPSGTHLVGVLLTDTSIRFFSDLISLGSVLILLSVIINFKSKQTPLPFPEITS